MSDARKLLRQMGIDSADPAPSGLTAAQETRRWIEFGANIATNAISRATEASRPDDPIDQSPIAVWHHDCGQTFSSYGPHPDTCFACHQPGAWTVLGPQCCPRCHMPWQEHDTDVLKRCDAMGDETPQIREWAGCPDPSMHDEDDRAHVLANLRSIAQQRDRAIVQVTDLERQMVGVAVRNGTLTAERDQAQADALEDQRVRLLLERQRDAVLAALAELVRLKDGPRDAAYAAAKDSAWARARAIYAERGDFDPTPDTDGVPTEFVPAPEEAEHGVTWATAAKVATDALLDAEARRSAVVEREAEHGDEERGDG